MIRVHMLTWPLTEANRSTQDGEAKKLIDIQPNSQRSHSFQALRAYFANIAAAFSQPKHRHLDDEPLVTSLDESNTELSVTKAVAVTIEEDPKQEEEASVLVDDENEKRVEIVESVEEVKHEQKEDSQPPKLLKKNISRIKVLGMVSSMQTSSGSSLHEIDSMPRRRLGSIKQWESMASNDDDTVEKAGGDSAKKEDDVKRKLDKSTPPSGTDTNALQMQRTSIDKYGSPDSTLKIGNDGDRKCEEKTKVIEQFEEEDDEGNKVVEENMDTLSVQDMVKGFMYIKQNPNLKKMPKSFKKRTTVTLVKPQ